MIRRYLRAFLIALQITLRGESLTPPDAPLQTWMAQGLNRLDMIDRLAVQHGLKTDAIVLHIDKRDITMSTILGAVRFHLTDEYPILLRQPSEQGLIFLRAANLDDHYRLTRLEEAPELAGLPVRQAVAALAAHLEAIPKNE